MSSSFASAFLDESPLEDLLVKDAYDVQSGDGNTSIQDALANFGKDLASSIRNTPQIASRIADLVSSARSGRLTKAHALLRVAGALGGSDGPLTKLSASVRNNVMSTLGVSSENQGRIISAVGTAVRVSRTTDIRGATEMISVLQEITGNSDIVQLFDMEAEVAVFGGILGEAVRLGLPDAFDAIMDQASDDRVRYQIAYETLPSVVFSSDILTMQKLIARVGAETVRALYPNFVRDFLKAYVLPIEDTVDMYPTRYAELVSLFNLVDPNWDKAPRGEVWVKSLTPFSFISKDAVTVLSSNPTHRLAVTIAQNVDSVDMVTWIKSKYPYFPMT